jgi:hypothetical protein
MGVEGGYQIYSSLAYAAAEAQSAWERSKEPEVREEMIMVMNDAGQPITDRLKRVTTTKGPNPSYLASYLQATLAIADLMGLESKELQRTTQEPTIIDQSYEELRKLSSEELMVLYRKQMGFG